MGQRVVHMTYERRMPIALSSLYVVVLYLYRTVYDILHTFIQLYIHGISQQGLTNSHFIQNQRLNWVPNYLHLTVETNLVARNIPPLRHVR